MASTRTLPTELTIYTVGELRAEWLAWLTEGAPMQVDETGHNEFLSVEADAVDQVDGAGVQLLVSLAHGLEQQQRSLRLLNPSAALSGACRSLGVGALLAPQASEAAA
jgi:anti-anti-sigma regulatory factor